LAHYGRIEYSTNFASDVVASGTRKRTKKWQNKGMDVVRNRGSVMVEEAKKGEGCWGSGKLGVAK